MHQAKPSDPFMARSESFRPDEEPFRHNDSLQIDHSATHGPIGSFAPTQATFSYSDSGGPSTRRRSYGTVPARQGDDNTRGDLDAQQRHGSHRRSNVDYKWTSRNSRKGRHTLLVGERSMAHDVDYSTPAFTNGLIPTLKGIWRMVSRFPFDDLSYVTATSFVSGCALLVVNAFLSLLPRLRHDIQLSSGATMAQAWLTFLGCTLFLVSSSLSYLEAVNANKDGCFGWSPEQTAPESSGNNEGLGIGETTQLVPDEQCNDHYTQHDSAKGEQLDAFSNESGESSAAKPRGGQGRMRLVPTLRELRTTYIHDIGFIACATLLISTVIYWITSAASLVVTMVGAGTEPWIRVLQLVGAIGFAFASLIFMIETQDSWTVPALHMLGWHVGFWNLVGSCGFALFAAFALNAEESSQAQSSTHYFWGKCVRVPDHRTRALTNAGQVAGASSWVAQSNGTSRSTSILLSASSGVPCSASSW